MDLKKISLSPTYFDNATYMPMFQSVKSTLFEKMDIPFSCERPLYAKDEELKKEVESALLTIRAFFSLEEKDLILASSSHRQSIEFVYHLHLENVIKQTGKNHIFYLSFDRIELLEELKKLEEKGCILEEIPIDQNGQIDLEKLKNRITPRTSLISLSYADQSTGVVQNIYELQDLCQSLGVSLHLDLSSIMGKIYFSSQATKVSYMTYSGHRQGGVDGLALVLIPYQYSYRHLADRLFLKEKEYGKLLATSVFFYECMQMTDEFFFDMPTFKETFEASILEAIDGVKILFSNIERLQSHSIIYFPHVHAELFLFILKEKNVFASIGKTGENTLSHQLQKMHIPLIEAKSALCFSFSHKTKKEGIQEGVQLIKESYEKVLKLNRKKGG